MTTTIAESDIDVSYPFRIDKNDDGTYNILVSNSQPGQIPDFRITHEDIEADIVIRWMSNALYNSKFMHNRIKKLAIEKGIIDLNGPSASKGDPL